MHAISFRNVVLQIFFLIKYDKRIDIFYRLYVHKYFHEKENMYFLLYQYTCFLLCQKFHNIY